MLANNVARTYTPEIACTYLKVQEHWDVEEHGKHCNRNDVHGQMFPPWCGSYMNAIGMRGTDGIMSF